MLKNPLIYFHNLKSRTFLDLNKLSCGEAFIKGVATGDVKIYITDKPSGNDKDGNPIPELYKTVDAKVFSRVSKSQTRTETLLKIVFLTLFFTREQILWSENLTPLFFV